MSSVNRLETMPVPEELALLLLERHSSFLPAGASFHSATWLPSLGTGGLLGFTSASELRGLGRTQLPGRILEALVTQPFLIILIPTSGKLDQLLDLFIH